MVIFFKFHVDITWCHQVQPVQPTGSAQPTARCVSSPCGAAPAETAGAVALEAVPPDLAEAHVAAADMDAEMAKLLAEINAVNGAPLDG